MEQVGVRELRQNLSVYLRRIARGATFEVTDRGRPVAIIRPIALPDDGFARLEARGIPIRHGAGNLAELPAPAKLDLDRSLTDILEESREERV